MKKILICIFAALLVVCGYACFSGAIGISQEQINTEQLKTISSEEDYDVTGATDDESLYVGVMYTKDYSDARYFIYIKREGLFLGWHFLQSGNLTESEGIKALDCGAYGTAYVALNTENTIQRIEFTDDREPSVNENAGKIICEQSKSTILFYDKDGNTVECDRQTVKQ